MNYEGHLWLQYEFANFYMLFTLERERRMAKGPFHVSLFRSWATEVPVVIVLFSSFSFLSLNLLSFVNIPSLAISHNGCSDKLIRVVDCDKVLNYSSFLATTGTQRHTYTLVTSSIRNSSVEDHVCCCDWYWYGCSFSDILHFSIFHMFRSFPSDMYQSRW
jgi:hypothetical protein